MWLSGRIGKRPAYNVGMAVFGGALLSAFYSPIATSPHWTGYVPEAAQTPLALHGIRPLIGPVPALFFIAGILVLAG